jgi:hypothetical protein
MFDSDTESNHFRLDVRLAPILVWHLSMCSLGWVPGQRLGIAKIHKPGNQSERIVELDRGSEAPLTPKAIRVQPWLSMYFRASL